MRTTRTMLSRMVFFLAAALLHASGVGIIFAPAPQPFSAYDQIDVETFPTLPEPASLLAQNLPRFSVEEINRWFQGMSRDQQIRFLSYLGKARLWSTTIEQWLFQLDREHFSLPPQSEKMDHTLWKFTELQKRVLSDVLTSADSIEGLWNYLVRAGGLKSHFYWTVSLLSKSDETAHRLWVRLIEYLERTPVSLRAQEDWSPVRLFMTSIEGVPSELSDRYLNLLDRWTNDDLSIAEILDHFEIKSAKQAFLMARTNIAIRALHSTRTGWSSARRLANIVADLVLETGDWSHSELVMELLSFRRDSLVQVEASILASYLLRLHGFDSDLESRSLESLKELLTESSSPYRSRSQFSSRKIQQALALAEKADTVTREFIARKIGFMGDSLSFSASFIGEQKRESAAKVLVSPRLRASFAAMAHIMQWDRGAPFAADCEAALKKES